MTVKKYQIKQTLYWFSILFVFSVIDYIDHITRSDNTFKQIALKWLLYSISNTLYIFSGSILLFLLLDLVLPRFILRYFLELIAVLFVFWTFQFIGPYIVKLYDIELTLYFNVTVEMFVALALIYTFFWLIYHKSKKAVRYLFKNQKL